MKIAMDTQNQTSSKTPSSTSTEWTPERIERMRLQDEASAEIRQALGQVVTTPGRWSTSLPKDRPSSPKDG